MKFSNNQSGVVLLCVKLFNDKSDFNELVEEGRELVLSADYDLKSIFIVNRGVVDSKFFIGSGKLEELKVFLTNLQAKMLVVNHNLTPLQEKNLTKNLNLEVIDRTSIILDIFAKRVRSNEGVLQVELAKQRYMATRLVRRWTHLERQRGGLGNVAGGGEKQIELDKRAIKEKIKRLNIKLDQVVKQRQNQRKKREKTGTFSISIVGYTNAGKSTLFNGLTNSSTYVENKLFATLQTTSRRLYLSEELLFSVVISDTVGFIRDLPHGLVAAFRATLEETVHADLLLNVVDVSNDVKDLQIAEVNKVLKELNADKIPHLIIYNKIDIKPNIVPKIMYSEAGEPEYLYISAYHKQGFDLLREAIVQKIKHIATNTDVETLDNYEPWSNT